MTRFGSPSSVPLDVWLGAGLVAGGGLVFLAVGLVRWLTEGGIGVVALPAVVGGIELGAATATVAGVRWAHRIVLVIVALVAVAHLLIALDGARVWTRVVSAGLAAVAVFALVVLNSRPVREHCGGRA